MGYPVEKSDEEWREQLSPDEYQVLRKAGTERPFVGEYTDTKTEGVYRCRACQAELFRSDTKFDSHCGWPSFYAPLAEDRVEYIEDTLDGHEARRGALRAPAGRTSGHVFEGEGYDTPTDQRYCINSISLTLEPDASAADGLSRVRAGRRAARRPGGGGRCRTGPPRGRAAARPTRAGGA